MKARPRLTVVGSANLDFTMQVPHLPACGETVAGGRFARHFGGKGANQAVAAARAGAEVTWIGCVGADLLTREMLAHFDREGLDLSHSRVLEGHPTGTALVIYDQSGRNYLAVDSGANQQLTRKQIEDARTTLATSDGILLQMEVPAAINRLVIELAAGCNVPVLLNYAPAHDLSLAGLPMSGGLVVNENEAGALLGKPIEAEDEASCRKATATLLKSGHRFVVLTLGSRGAFAGDANGLGHYPALPVAAVDTTAAGDTFCGYLATALAQGRSLDEALRWSNQAAALSVGKAGAQDSIPTVAEVNLTLAPK